MEDVALDPVAEQRAIERMARLMHKAFQEYCASLPKEMQLHFGTISVTWDELDPLSKDAYRATARSFLRDR
jgi:hypothetical protein